MESFKSKVYQVVVDNVDEKITIASEAMKASQEAANSETKSTAGDKHDTARAMMHLERDKVAQQLAAYAKLKKVLREIRNVKKSSTVVVGSLVKTNVGLYYLSISIGALLVDNQQVFVLSAISPIGKELLGKKENDTFVFQNRTQKILEIY